jgi:hypothetical protein
VLEFKVKPLSEPDVAPVTYVTPFEPLMTDSGAPLRPTALVKYWAPSSVNGFAMDTFSLYVPAQT